VRNLNPGRGLTSWKLSKERASHSLRLSLERPMRSLAIFERSEINQIRRAKAFVRTQLFVSFDIGTIQNLRPRPERTQRRDISGMITTCCALTEPSTQIHAQTDRQTDIFKTKTNFSISQNGKKPQQTLKKLSRQKRRHVPKDPRPD
jgi:hypothetical protein